jgi:uncharacterized membrane protein YtjA (UPF0391 family)
VGWQISVQLILAHIKAAREQIWAISVYVQANEKEIAMLYYALVFLVIALIAGVLGFGGIAGASASIAQVLFFIFIVLFIVSVVMRLMRRV